MYHISQVFITSSTYNINEFLESFVLRNIESNINVMRIQVIYIE